MSHMITDKEQIREFTRAGRATFTLVSKASGRRVTYKVTRPKGAKWDDSSGLVVKALVGPDNGADYVEIGLVDTNGKFTVTNFRKKAAEHKVRALAWFWRQSEAQSDKLDQAEIWHEGRCGRCGKKLTVPESISTGLGPICGAKVASHT